MSGRGLQMPLGSFVPEPPDYFNLAGNKKKTIIAAAAILAISTSAFAQSAAESTGVNSLMGNAPRTEDFVTEAATSDMFEIASSKLAVEKADPATKTFAQQMITDHTKTSSELKQMVDTGKVKAAIPAAMTSSQQSMIDKLNGLQGDDFNKQYHDYQVSAQGCRRSVQEIRRWRRQYRPQDLGFYNTART